MKKLLLLSLLLSGCAGSIEDYEAACESEHEKHVAIEKCIMEKHDSSYDIAERLHTASILSGGGSAANKINARDNQNNIFDAMMLARMELAIKQDKGEISEVEADIKREEMRILARSMDVQFRNSQPVAPVIKNIDSSPKRCTAHHMGSFSSINCR